jgi:OmpA-OmpF porin, OOP family
MKHVWLFTLFSIAASTAAAQGINGQSYDPAVGAAGGFVVERPVVPKHFGFGVGLLGNFANDLVVERDGATGIIVGHPLEYALTFDLVGSLALFDFFEIALDVPLSAVYYGQPTSLTGTTLIAQPGFGDIRLVPKAAFTMKGTSFAFGAALPLSAPTGDPLALRGDGVFTANPELLAGYRGSRFGVAMNLGALLRPPGPLVENEITYGLGGQIALWPDADILDLILEAHGSSFISTLTPSVANFPLEMLAGLGWAPHPDWTIEGGVGVGITRGVTDPRYRMMLGVRYVPKPASAYADKDGDGVSDDNDKCPNRAEDHDGIADEDGCPESDADHDKIKDDDDECPEDSEGSSGDGDGCPEGDAEFRDNKIIIRGKVQFETGSSQLKPKSERLLDRVAALMKANPGIKKVRVEGHTDETGPEGTNQVLSEKRAQAVKRALEKRGIERSRLEARGYGESRPRAPNTTPAGRAKNRRVEFVVVN